MRAALAPLLLAAYTRSLAVRRITTKMSAAQGVLLTKAGKDGAQITRDAAAKGPLELIRTQCQDACAKDPQCYAYVAAGHSRKRA